MYDTVIRRKGPTHAFQSMTTTVAVHDATHTHTHTYSTPVTSSPIPFQTAIIIRLRWAAAAAAVDSSRPPGRRRRWTGGGNGGGGGSVLIPGEASVRRSLCVTIASIVFLLVVRDRHLDYARRRFVRASHCHHLITRSDTRKGKGQYGTDGTSHAFYFFKKQKNRKRVFRTGFGRKRRENALPLGGQHNKRRE